LKEIIRGILAAERKREEKCRSYRWKKMDALIAVVNILLQMELTVRSYATSVA
jgi:hypothetical protein